MNPTWKAILGALAIFIFGWLAGTLSTSLFIGHKMLALYRGGPVAAAHVLEKRMTRNLNLDASQKIEIEGFFLENANKRIQLEKQIQPQIQVLNQQTIKEVNDSLRPDQAEKFHTNLEYFKMHAGRGFFSPAADSSPVTPESK
jgi:hypothetical protein